jgi:hypothetical protein
MSLDYPIISQTTGDENSVSQVLTQNQRGRFNVQSVVNFFSFDYPAYYVEGATLNYYEKDYNSISYDISNGKIYTLIFTANTQVLTGTNSISHVLYRIKQEDYNLFVTDPENNGFLLNQYLTTPLFGITEYCSGLTINGGIYTYSFPTQFKDIGQFTQEIFNDKDQFFLDTPIGFDQYNDLTIGDAYYMDSTNTIDGVVYPSRLYLEPSATTRVNSGLGPKVITGDTLASGYTFQGAFFTYFVPPKKPNLNVSLGRQQISVQGFQNTLSPIFNFNNTDDGDYYQLQVNYDTADTPYSGSDIYTYVINKQAGDAEFVRTFSTPLRANDSFIYRIGNTKELDNIFGNKQSITTWSDTIEAQIISSGRYNFSGTTWRNIISDSYYGFYHMSGITVGAETSSSRTFTFTTQVNALMAIDTISASTNAFDTVTIDYNGNLNTLQWQNAIYAAAGFSSMDFYVIGGTTGSTPINITDFTFSISTESRRFSGVTVQLNSIFLNTSLDLSIDRRSSSEVAFNISENYTDTTVGQQYTRVTDSAGRFDFGSIIGGYYRLYAAPSTPPAINAQYQPIEQFVTINSDTYLDLIFSIYWNNQTTNGFLVLSNQTFL